MNQLVHSSTLVRANSSNEMIINLEVLLGNSTVSGQIYVLVCTCQLQSEGSVEFNSLKATDLL